MLRFFVFVLKLIRQITRRQRHSFHDTVATNKRIYLPLTSPAKPSYVDQRAFLVPLSSLLYLFHRDHLVYTTREAVKAKNKQIQITSD